MRCSTKWCTADPGSLCIRHSRRSRYAAHHSASLHAALRPENALRRYLRLVPADFGGGIVAQHPAERKVEQRQQRRAGKGHGEIGQAEVLAAAPGERQFSNAATNEMPKPRHNCCAMLAMLVAELISACSMSA